jgi:hypothetical protein
MQLLRVLQKVMTANERNLTAVLLSERHQNLLEVLPAGLGAHLVGEEPEHGQIGLQIGVKVVVVDLALINNQKKKKNVRTFSSKLHVERVRI